MHGVSRRDRGSRGRQGAQRRTSENVHSFQVPAPIPTGATTNRGNEMTAAIDQITRFSYTTYILATPEQVWQGLTVPAFTERYWRHPRAGGKTFRSDWMKGSPYDLVHDEVGLVVSDPDQVCLLYTSPSPRD